METKELQSRREFFKTAAKKSLPLLGIVVGLNMLAACEKDNENEGSSNSGSSGSGSGCNGSCTSKCSSSCTGGCSSGCKNNCVGGSCKEMCIHSCKGTFLKVNNPADNGTSSL